MTKLQRFIPQTPDPYLRQADQLGSVRFGHLNALVDAINATVYGDYLQLAGSGPMSTTLRPLEDPDGNIANLYLATDKTAISGSLKIGDTTANLPSAILEISSTTKGVLLPKMTTAQRDAIVSPAVGLIIYNTDEVTLNQWDGTDWTEIGGGGGLGLLNDALMTSTLTEVVDKENTESALLLSTERVGISADPTATTQAMAVIQATTLNSGIAIVPNGTGAITARVPDGTNTGGNTRGINAVDFQQLRYSPQFVASGQQSVIAGGVHNTASGIRSSILGGEENRTLSSHSSVGGGFANTASTGTHATVVGGQSNVSSGQSSVSGGISNTASGTSAIALGRSNNISGDSSFGFGNSNTVSSPNSGAFGISNIVASNTNYNFAFGLQNSFISNPNRGIAIGNDNYIIGGTGGIAVGSFSRTTDTYGLATGFFSVAYLRAQHAHGNGVFVNEGSKQYSNLIASKQGDLTTGATTVLSLDGTGITNLIIPEGNRTWNVTVKTVARVISITGTATGVSLGDSYMQDDTILFKRVSNVSSVVGVNNTNIIADTSMGTAVMAYSAGASQELALMFTAPTFTGGGSILINIVSKIELVEVGN